MDGRILYNPLAALGKGKGFVAAIFVVAALTVVAWWGGVHLDGALDLHITTDRPSVNLVIAESLIDWLSLGILLFITSKLFGGNGGLGAHLAATGLSRFPYIFASVLMSRQLLGKAMLKAVSVSQQEVTVRPQDLMTPAVIIGSLILLVLVIWSVVLLYLGYKDASRVRGGKVVVAFVTGLILAEIASKLLVMWAVRAGI